MRATIASVASGMLLLAAPARSESWQADLSATWQSGDYGSTETTTMFEVPLMIKRFFSRGEAMITIPYLSVDTSSETEIAVGDATIGGEGSGAASGLGDIVAKGRFYATAEHGAVPYVDLVARIKLPTAGTDLGTGEVDFGFGAELSHSLGGKHFVMADAMYTVTGDPSGADYLDRVAWSLGGGWQPRRGTTLSLSYDYKNALQSSDTPARSLLLYGIHRLHPDLRLYGMLDVGLSDGSPDFGLTAGVKRDF